MKIHTYQRKNLTPCEHSEKLITKLYFLSLTTESVKCFGRYHSKYLTGIQIFLVIIKYFIFARWISELFVSFVGISLWLHFCDFGHLFTLHYISGRVHINVPTSQGWPWSITNDLERWSWRCYFIVSFAWWDFCSHVRVRIQNLLRFRFHWFLERFTYHGYK